MMEPNPNSKVIKSPLAIRFLQILYILFNSHPVQFPTLHHKFQHAEGFSVYSVKVVLNKLDQLLSYSFTRHLIFIVKQVFQVLINT